MSMYVLMLKLTILINRQLVACYNISLLYARIEFDVCCTYMHRRVVCVKVRV